MEATKSSNIVLYIDGFKVTLTLRDEKEKVFPLLKKMLKVVDFAKKKGYKPSWNESTNESVNGEPDWIENGITDEVETPAQMCAVHKVKMTKYEKDGRSWYSHTDGTRWCSGQGWKK